MFSLLQEKNPDLDHTVLVYSLCLVVYLISVFL